jgi:hypothetical protein
LASDPFVPSFQGEVVSLTWNAVAGAAAYVVEIGSQSGASDVLNTETGGASYSWSPSQTGDYFVQIRAKNAVGLGPKSTPLSIAAFSFKQLVEMLFLGTGPYADPSSPGCGTGQMHGWRDGTDIRVRASNVLSPLALDGVRSATEQLAQATGGVVRGHLETTSEITPIPADGEITVTHFSGNECGNPAAAGCAGTARLSGQFTLAAFVYLAPTSNPGPGPHEIGHAAYGFCHVRSSIGGVITRFSSLTAMGYGTKGNKLTVADLRAVRAVYDAGLRAGATRAAFVGAGLIDP